MHLSEIFRLAILFFEFGNRELEINLELSVSDCQRMRMSFLFGDSRLSELYRIFYLKKLVERLVLCRSPENEVKFCLLSPSLLGEVFREY